MKSNKPPIILATKRVHLGMFPLFIQLGHKGLEKSQPTPVAVHKTRRTYVVPKDILRVSVSDSSLYENIEAIEFTYEKELHG